MANFLKHFKSKERVEAIKKMQCIIYGCTSKPTECAHVRSRGAGGDYRDIVPLCPSHHAEQHQMGIHSFCRKHGTTKESLLEEAHQIADYLDSKGY